MINNPCFAKHFHSMLLRSSLSNPPFIMSLRAFFAKQSPVNRGLLHRGERPSRKDSNSPRSPRPQIEVPDTCGHALPLADKIVRAEFRHVGLSPDGLME